MDTTERPVIITGNWKMYKTIEEGRSFLEKLIPLMENASAEPWLAVPFTSIYPLAELAKESRVIIGGQNMNDASEGAFTGEIAGNMLKEAGAKFVLLGHSERRKFYRETNQGVNQKLKRALEAGLRPVVCVGETEQEREEGREHAVLESQLTECLMDISKDHLTSLIVAYEPVWAIGTGKTASPEIAQEAHAHCREILKKILSESLANKIVIQYGGSVNPSNALTLLNQSDIDGLLIGGASLSLESFSQIVNDIKPKVQSL